MKKEKLKGKTLKQAAAAGNMCEKTARNYLKSDKLPSELKDQDRNYRTRKDVFIDEWLEIKELLELNPRLQAKTIFEHLQKKHPNKFQNNQLRTLQRKVKTWRAQSGPTKEVFFDQVHTPGRLCQSDFTNMNKLEITICGKPFKHLFYHFVLTYSNWETGTVCYSESFEALSQGLQNALWDLGGVPGEHRTDRLTAAVNNHCNKKDFNRRYQEILDHYQLQGMKTQPYSPNENGDVEQSHYRFKTAVDQALMLRGSRNFELLADYILFLNQIMKSRNTGRRVRFLEEQKVLGNLPVRRLNVFKSIEAKVTRNSVIKVANNRYSVPSRLIGEWVKARQYADHIEIYYANRLIQTIPRLRGRSKSSIDYRHIIHSLVRKPGAFESYKYRDFMFPGIYYRMTYDSFKSKSVVAYVKKYLQILQLAALEGEQVVEQIIRTLIDRGEVPEPSIIKSTIEHNRPVKLVTDVVIEKIDLHDYDSLLMEVR